MAIFSSYRVLLTSTALVSPVLNSFISSTLHFSSVVWFNSGLKRLLPHWRFSALLRWVASYAKLKETRVSVNFKVYVGNTQKQSEKVYTCYQIHRHHIPKQKKYDLKSKCKFAQNFNSRYCRSLFEIAKVVWYFVRLPGVIDPGKKRGLSLGKFF